MLSFSVWISTLLSWDVREAGSQGGQTNRVVDGTSEELLPSTAASAVSDALDHHVPVRSSGEKAAETIGSMELPIANTAQTNLILVRSVIVRKKLEISFVLLASGVDYCRYRYMKKLVLTRSLARFSSGEIDDFLLRFSFGS